MLNKPINFIKRLNIKKIFILLTRVFKFSRKKGVNYEKYTILTFISKNKIMPVIMPAKKHRDMGFEYHHG